MKANILRHGAKALQKMNPRSSMLRAFTTSTWQLQAQKPTPSTLEADIPANVLLDELDLLIPAPEDRRAFEAPQKFPVLKFGSPEEVVEEIELDENVFGREVRVDLLHQTVVWQRANARTTTYKGKGRSEVRGGGRKPRPQKGSGRARIGSIRSPLMKGGGRAHPPKVRDWSISLPKKIRRAALASALSLKFRDYRLAIVDDFELEGHKSKALKEMLDAHGYSTEGNGVVIVDGPRIQDELLLASRNIPHCLVLPYHGLNVYDLLKREFVMFTRTGLELTIARLTKPLSEWQALLAEKGLEEYMVGKVQHWADDMEVEGEEEAQE